MKFEDNFIMSFKCIQTVIFCEYLLSCILLYNSLIVTRIHLLLDLVNIAFLQYLGRYFLIEN